MWACSCGGWVMCSAAGQEAANVDEQGTVTVPGIAVSMSPQDLVILVLSVLTVVNGIVVCVYCARLRKSGKNQKYAVDVFRGKNQKYA